MRKLIGTFTLVLMALGLFMAPANAAVNYDPATGGFAGKGDIQTLFGWNNAALQQNAGSLSFTYQSTSEYSQVCSKTIEQKTETKIVSNTFSDTVYVNATVAYDAKTNRQVVGFNLAPVGTGAGTIPTDLCPNDNSGFVAEDEFGNPTAPQLVSSSGGSLYVNGTALPNTPAI